MHSEESAIPRMRLGVLGPGERGDLAEYVLEEFDPEEWPVVEKMLDRGMLRGHELIVALLTSTGLKDPEVTATRLRNVPVIAATEDDLTRVLRDEYGMTLQDTASASAR